MPLQKIILIVEPHEAGRRLDVYLSDALEGFSRSYIQNLIKKGCVRINDKEQKASYKLKIADSVEVEIPDAQPLELKAQNIPLDIRYEDDNMLVVNKPSGMLTHPTSVQKEDTLVNALLYYCKDNLSGINGIMRPGILHRLDKNTSGLLMIAKNDYAHNFLAQQIKEKSAIRQYLTVVHGVLKEDEGTINAPIGRHPLHREKMGVVEDGKRAVSHYKVLERFKNFTYVEMTLETGRTHQIRVHMSYIKHPILGDTIYGGGSANMRLNEQVLQAYKLTFLPPGANIQKVIELEPDDELKKVLKILRGKN